MKYVWIFVVVVILVRIDFILRFFDKTSAKYENSKTLELKPEEVVSETELVSVENDLSLKTNPRKIFLFMLDDFQSTPDKDIKDRAVESLKTNPVMFNEKLDKDLEAAVFRWRDLLVQRNKVTHEFIFELLKLLKGENLEMLKRFFSFAIDVDLKEFLSIYSKSSDTNCLIMVYLGDQLSDEERYNELSERLMKLEGFLAATTPDPLKPYAQRCQLVLKLEVEKLRGSFAPPESLAPLPDAEAAPVPPAITNPIPETGTTP